MIEGKDELQKAYQDEGVARDYVQQRFEAPLGALLHARQTAVVRGVIAKLKVGRAAEIAPGPARVTVDVAPDLAQLTLMDASIQMLQEARRRLTARGLASKARFVQADAFNLPVKSQFDLIYSFRLIRHFERPDRLRLYSEIRALLAPGGRLVFDAVNRKVSAPLRAVAAAGEYQHYDALLTEDEIRGELQEAGLEVESMVAIQHNYPWLLKSQTLVAPRSRHLARWMMELIDRLGGDPLEWVVVCRRK